MATQMQAKTLTADGDKFIAYLSHPGWVSNGLRGPDVCYNTQFSTCSQLDTMNKLLLEDNGKFFDLEGKIIFW